MATLKSAARRSIAQIDFFYDVASPYSWLAFETLMRYKNVWDAEINLKPFFLGGVMKETGNKPPATLKAKLLYMMKDLGRMAEYHGVPLKPIKDRNAMYNTLGAQRLLTAASIDAPAELEVLTREMWKRLWGGGGDIASAQGLREACTNAGLESSLVEALMQTSESQAVKERLQHVTEEALKRGAFGAPWITLKTNCSEGEGAETEDEHWHSFWGCDRFDVLARTLGQPWFGPHPDTSSRKQAQL